MPVHQQFKADLDTKPYEAGLHRMENATRTSSTRTAREFDRVQQSTNRMARSVGGGKGAMRAGQAAMQMQDIGIQMQMGARASTIIAQQGSQILSIFGPYGMLLGGLTAAAAMFWEVVRGAKALNKEAIAAKALKGVQENTAAMKRANDALRTDQDTAKVARIRAQFGKEAADAAERELDYKRRIADIENNSNLSRGVKDVMKEAAAERKAAEDAVRMREKARDIREEAVEKGGDAVIKRADQIRGKGLSKADQRRENRARRNAERRAINERIDEADRKARNTKDGTNFGKQTGLTKEQKDAMREGGRNAVKAAKDDKVMAAFSDEQLVKIVNSIEGLLAK